MSIKLLDLSSSGIEFHSLGAATENARSPYVFSLAFGVARRCWEDDLNFRSGVWYCVLNRLQSWNCGRPYSRELQLSNFAVTKAWTTILALSLSMYFLILAIFLIFMWNEKTCKLILCDPQSWNTYQRWCQDYELRMMVQLWHCQFEESPKETWNDTLSW